MLFFRHIKIIFFTFFVFLDIITYILNIVRKKDVDKSETLYLKTLSLKQIEISYASLSFGSIGSSLGTGFQVYLSKCWDPYMSPGCMIQRVFFCSSSVLDQHDDLVTTSLRAGFQVYLF